MTLLNGFFYLIMILAGIAVAMILVDLRMKEERAENDLLMLDSERMPMVRHTLTNEKNNPLLNGYSVSARVQISRETASRPLISFFAIPSSPEQRLSSPPASASLSVSYDFSWARFSQKKEQADDCLLPDISRTDCCA